jgi:hypothetical protein
LSLPARKGLSLDYSQYLRDLDELAQMINKSMCHGYVHLSRTSELGEACGYARKAKNYFLREEEPAIRQKITSIIKTHLVPEVDKKEDKS